MKCFKSFQLDTDNQCLWHNGMRIYLAPKTFAVLHYLLERPGRLVTQDELLEALWGNKYVQPEIVKKYILEIRRILEDHPRKPVFIETLPKRGYRFIAAVTEEPPLGSAVLSQCMLRGVVGRETALAKLHDALCHAGQGERRIICITGEMGIGKTALIDALQHEVAVSRTAPRMAYSQCIPAYGHRELYYPMLDALGQLSRQPEGEVVVSILAQYAPTWLAQLPSLISTNQREMLQREIIGATRERMLREICEALEAITSDRPLILAFDDLHWTDPATVELISALARRRESAKLLLIAAYSPADVMISHHPLKALTQDLQIHRLCEEIRLELLDEAAVRDYLAIEFPGNALPNGLTGLIHRHSDGNSLFMVAIVDHLVERNLIVQAGGRWRLAVSLKEITVGVPDTLRQMLELQLDRLCPEEQQILEAASIAGEVFSVWTIAAMLDLDPAEIEEHCEHLAAQHQLLKTAGLQELPNGLCSPRYELTHSLYREVLYRRQSPGRRVKLHRQLGERLEALFADHVSDVAAQLALHFEESFDWQRAVVYLLLTAENAEHRYDHREAIAMLQHARDMLNKLDVADRAPQEIQILEKLGDIYTALGVPQRGPTPR